MQFRFTVFSLTDKNCLSRDEMFVVVSIEYTTRVWPIEYLNHSKYNVPNIIQLDKEALHTNIFAAAAAIFELKSV